MFTSTGVIRDASSSGQSFASTTLGGGFALTKTGSGALVLSQANTHTGGISLKSGILQLDNADAIGTGALIISGGTLDTSNASLGAIPATGTTKTLTLAGDFAFLGTQSMQFGSATVSHIPTLTANCAITCSPVVDTTALTFYDGIVESGGAFTLTKNGTGNLILSLKNTTTGGGTDNVYSGGTVINNGKIIVRNGTNARTAAPLGSGTITLNGSSSIWVNFMGSTSNALTVANNIVLNGGMLQSEDGNQTFSGNITMSAASIVGVVYLNKKCTLSGNISGTGQLVKNGLGQLVLSGSNASWSGGLSIQSNCTVELKSANCLGTGTLVFQQANAKIDNTTAGALTLTTNNAVSLASNATFTGTQALTFGTGTWTLTAARTLTVSASVLTIPGVIQGAFALTRAGTGECIFSGNNTYSGGTTLNSTGITRVGHNNGFGTGTITVSAGATIGVAASSGAKTIANAVSINTGISLTLAGGNGDLTLSGIISGLGNVIVGSTGFVFLNNGSNSYSGTTTTASTAKLGGFGKTGTGLTTIATGTVLFGGTGASNAGTLTIGGALTMSSGATLNVNIGSTTTVSRVVVTGALTLNTNAVVFQATPLNAGTYTLFTCTGTPTGTLAAPTLTGTNRTFGSYAYNNGSVTITLT